MPLVTNNIGEARTAYAALETRAQNAERLAQSLQSAIDNRVVPRPILQNVLDIHQIALNREIDNLQLRTQLQTAIIAKADLRLQTFIAAIGLAAAIGEGSMPDRVIPTLSATIQSYLTLSGLDVGLSFFQPGVGADSGSLSMTTFEISKVPPQPGTPSPRNLYVVLQDKQQLYTNSFWAQFSTATSAATQIVAAVTGVLDNTGSWNFAYLLQAAIGIGNLEKTLSGLVTSSSPGSAATAFSSAVASFQALTTALSNKQQPVAGDVLALAASLANVTNAGRFLLS